ncbi:protein SPT2 homolog [Topomyia yanbarensis]|uniref:protein SPT2 homolog n=1 Tax=Topomyia yanbarensis TaxID=2498891 RepID=UPI00273AC3BF|nr:protein SPT2 homolog [Topomyia yanbarensis]
MDFGKLLSVAQRNAANMEQKSEGRYYSTKFAPPKKECKEKKLSANIKKFLAKKEEEEREKALEEQRKRDELLAKRDPKAKRKIEKMLKVIKSANKSVLEDAIDTQDTALTLQGPDQPDEDDYGYTSNVASHFYQQLMEKYKNTPEEKKFKDGEKRTMSKDDIDRAKARVKEALNKAQEEENAPRTRKRKDAGEGTSGGGSEPPGSSAGSTKQVGPDRYDPDEERRKEAEAKAKEDAAKRKAKRPAGPAPPDFATLLKLAEQKQFEPVKVEVTEEKKEPERLMTKKEKKEYEERMAYLEQKKIRDRIRNDPRLSEKEKQIKLARYDAAKSGSRSSSAGSGSSSSTSVKPSSAPNVMAPNGRIPKLNSAGADRPPLPKPTSTAGSSKPPPHRPDDRQKPTPDPTARSKLEAALTAKKAPTSSLPPREPAASTSSAVKKPLPSSHPNGASAKQGSSSLKAAPTPSRNGPTASGASSSSSSLKTQQPVNGQKARSFPTAAATVPAGAAQKPRQFPPADVQRSRPEAPRSRPAPPSSDAVQQRSRPFPGPDVIRKRPSGGPPPPKKRRPVIEDSDSEYDSEMDDFIDDGDAEEDYSSHIRAIFGYDKSRYRDEDFDDRQMESNYAQQMREEFISKKLGLLEDLEDMRAEEEEKRQKALAKKQKAKGK